MIINSFCGFLDNKLLRLFSEGQRSWVFMTGDIDLINKYKFEQEGSSYVLHVYENTGIRAFSLCTNCLYKNGIYSLSTVNRNNNNTVYMAPDLETHYKLGIHPYDDGWTAVGLDDWKRDVEEIWQERTPIDGFIFDVAPKVYIKKKDEPYDEEKWERISKTGYE